MSTDLGSRNNVFLMLVATIPLLPDTAGAPGTISGPLQDTTLAVVSEVQPPIYSQLSQASKPRTDSLLDRVLGLTEPCVLDQTKDAPLSA